MTMETMMIKLMLVLTIMMILVILTTTTTSNTSILFITTIMTVIIVSIIIHIVTPSLFQPLADSRSVAISVSPPGGKMDKLTGDTWQLSSQTTIKILLAI